jgi:hypothetical protein
MELKDMVIGHVRSRRDLSILSQTCYDLREATLPFLFRVVEISTSRGLNSLRTAFELGNPGRLADMVRTFKLRATFDYPLNKGNRVCSNTTQSADCVVLGLIYAATKLTRIEIHYQLDQLKPIGRYNAYSIKGDALSNALTSAQATLKHLKLSYEAFIGSGIMRPAVRGFCSLRQLQCLQTVDIPLFLLLGWRPIGAPALADVLPSSLKMLRFGDDEWVDMLEWDESLIMEKFVEYFGDQRWKNTTPNLKSVVLSLWAYDDVNDDCPDREWKPNGGESSFKRLCSENGLLCEVIRNNWAWKKWNHLTGSN